MEIIEFPSVMIEWNMKTGETRKLGEFQEYCQPLSSKISKFCEELTGITQDIVDRPNPEYNKPNKFPKTLHRHYKWMESVVPFIEKQKHVYIITVGVLDIQKQLPRDLKRWGIRIQSIPVVYQQFYDIKSEYKRYFHRQQEFSNIKKERHPTRGFGMANMLKGLNLTLDGRHHSGIDDCRNTAKILIKLIELGLLNTNMKLQYIY